MNKKEKILVTGGSGFLGKHLLKNLVNNGYENVTSVGSKDYDLVDVNQVNELFDKVQPTYVFSLAAKVGGILDNKNYPADFFYLNTIIGANIFNVCKNYNVAKLINVGAGCGYPLNATEPLQEKDIWLGYPQAESAPYSLAKRMLIVQSEAYRKQYGLNSVVCIPSNIYGEYDNFNLEKSHVIPALVRKFYEATNSGSKTISIWGDGSAKRDFIHASDVAAGLVEAAKINSSHNCINLAYGKQHTIKEIVEYLGDISKFTGIIHWDTEMPSGQSSREFSLERQKIVLPNFNAKVDIKSGLTATYSWFEKEYQSLSTRL